mmetsp:Transcript_7421/g.10417  ORF Transcript_7421/g.10417 Transcript_7421/m.10417 type:complete len:654 (-) Transcript_7421:254-2215(-)
MPHDKFFRRYGRILPRDIKKNGIKYSEENTNLCIAAESHIGDDLKSRIPIRLWQIGSNITFFKPVISRKLEELLNKCLEEAACKITSMMKMFVTRKRYNGIREALKALQVSLSEKEANFNTIEMQINKCMELKVTDRLLIPAKRRISELIEARDILRHAMEASTRTLEERIQVMEHAKKKVERIIPGSEGLRILRDVIPLLKGLTSMIPKRIAEAYNDREAGTKLRAKIENISGHCKQYNSLMLNLTQSEEIIEAIQILDELDEKENSLHTAAKVRDINLLERTIRSLELDKKGEVFARPALQRAKDVKNALRLEKLMTAALESGEIKHIEDNLLYAEKKLMENPSWAEEKGSLLSALLARSANVIILTSRLDDAISTLPTVLSSSKQEGRRGVSRIQRAVSESKKLLEEASDLGFKSKSVAELSRITNETQDETEKFLEQIEASERKAARQALIQRALSLHRTKSNKSSSFRASIIERDDAPSEEKIRSENQTVEELHEKEMKLIQGLLKEKDLELKRLQAALNEMREKVSERNPVISTQASRKLSSRIKKQSLQQVDHAASFSHSKARPVHHFSTQVLVFGGMGLLILAMMKPSVLMAFIIGFGAAIGLASTQPSLLEPQGESLITEPPSSESAGGSLSSIEKREGGADEE